MGRRYQEMEILSASPEELVARLFECAIQHCRAAGEHDHEGRRSERSHAISKALDILAELRSSLDHERGGDLADNLDALYLFAWGRLLEANLSDSPATALAEVVGVLTPVHGAWQELAKRGSAA